MRFGASRSQLYDAQKSARARWESTEEVWADNTRKEFENETFEPLDRAVSDVLRAVDQLGVLFAQIRQECEFPG
jgi:predicted nucleotide-binding protein (sugar kinase/HSP70/actin superfamily)